MPKCDIAFWTMKLNEKFNKNYKTKWTCKTYIPVEICLKPKIKGINISQTF